MPGGGRGRGRAAHPRVCGENTWPDRPRTSSDGSPPRVRGKRVSDVDRVRDPRLTPACAGKTVECFHCGSFVGAHPRVCGENVGCKHNPIETTGSPPRVRGKPARRVGRQPPSGLTPACAGKTSVRGTREESTGAHPRVCGENRILLNKAWRIAGSPPRVRGKHREPRAARACDRLTPACAGKTQHPRRTGCSGTAHPRVCGENTGLKPPLSRGAGSSPRVRGKRPPLRGSRARRGLIPACAGKTVCHRSTSSTSRAHPRVCGENLGDWPRHCGPYGSSPRVRGKRSRVPVGRLTAWLIPACAGKTR